MKKAAGAKSKGVVKKGKKDKKGKKEPVCHHPLDSRRSAKLPLPAPSCPPALLIFWVCAQAPKPTTDDLDADLASYTAAREGGAAEAAPVEDAAMS